GPIPGGEVPPESPEPPAAKLGEVAGMAVLSPMPGAKPLACLAYPSPRPGDPSYAPFLVLVLRLYEAAAKLGEEGPTGWPFYFPPFDDGTIVALSTPLKTGEDCPKALARIESVVAEVVAPRLRPDEAQRALQQFGFLLGLVDVPDAMLAQNPY